MQTAATAKPRIVRWYDWTGTLVWVALLTGVLVMVAIDPDARSVVWSYRDGSRHFFASEPLYATGHSPGGYLYSPGFAVFYAPFSALGTHVGDVLWRAVGFAVLSWAAIRHALRIGDERPVWLISCGFFLAAPLCAGAIRNGQATILLAGTSWLLLQVALENKRTQTLLLAILAVLAKPTAIVALLLAGALRPRLIPLLVLAVAGVLLLPFAVAPADYARDVTVAFFGLLQNLSFDPFAAADFTAPFTALGIGIPAVVVFAIRVLAALATLLAVLWFARHGEKETSALAIVVLAVYYMSVFNPRVEGNTYALLAVPFGLSIALMVRREGARVLQLTLGALLFLSGFVAVEPHVHAAIRFWIQPVVSTLLFAGILAWFWSRARQAGKVAAKV